MVTIRQVRKDHSLSANFVINSIFSNRNQSSLSSSKVYDELITMTEKNVGVPVLVGELYPFPNWESSISRQIRHVFNMRVHEERENASMPQKIEFYCQVSRPAFVAHSHCGISRWLLSFAIKNPLNPLSLCFKLGLAGLGIFTCLFLIFCGNFCCHYTFQITSF